MMTTRQPITTTVIRDYTDACILHMEFSTTGFCGGDAGHGGMTTLALQDSGGCAMEVTASPEVGICLALQGDAELRVFARAIHDLNELLAPYYDDEQGDYGEDAGDLEMIEIQARKNAKGFVTPETRALMATRIHQGLCGSPGWQKGHPRVESSVKYAVEQADMLLKQMGYLVMSTPPPKLPLKSTTSPEPSPGGTPDFTKNLLIHCGELMDKASYLVENYAELTGNLENQHRALESYAECRSTADYIRGFYHLPVSPSV